MGPTPTLPTKARTTPKRKISEHEFTITLYQGLKRQIREMCKAVQLTVVRLVRTDFGPLNIGKLKPGEYRHLTSEELATLKKTVGIC
ncbi:TPA: hypothetical protein DCY43_02415 [candidate division WWE3 bacterium]|uniref:Pseudouridine synthase RsuA/RluA-like domain-containing protein n=1 Tax=candidate division WWE3 bacterium TaxID=2053526 RepID=A0A351JTG2_UNCKA|nr:hypothetical protein [candidate division WWE3 bacterium]